MALILVRHTRPAESGLCYGRTDVCLGDSFPAEADTLAAVLTPAPIVTSPLPRCRRLAEHLAARLGASVTTDSRLAEMDFGAWENRPWDDIPRAELDAWAANLLHARPHGGETVAELLARTREALAAHPGPAILVTHAGVIRAAFFAATGDPTAWQRPVPFATAIPLT